MKKIVIVEDDKILYGELANLFIKEGYKIEKISSFAKAHQEIEKINPDLAVLDINLPDASGFTICKYLKENTSIPVLILTGRDSLEDEIRSLNLGADEYLTKPCNPERLLLRAKKLMNLYEKFKDSLVLGDISFDPTSYKLSYKKDYIIFPLTEGEILKNLLEAYPDLVKKDQLLEEVWSSKYIDENILHVNITRLRKKLAAIGLKGLIKNVRGLGYKILYEEENHE